MSWPYVYRKTMKDKMDFKVIFKRAKSIKEKSIIFSKTFAVDGKFYILRNMLWEVKTKCGLVPVEMATAKSTT